MSRLIKQAFLGLLAAVLLIPAGWYAPAVQAAAEVTKTVYHETFAGGAGKASQSGGASLSAAAGIVFDGNTDGAALYVSNRVKNWDAADFKFADIGLEDGKKYTVTAVVYVDASVSLPAGASAALQTVSSYGNYADVPYQSGKSVVLSKEFTADISKDQALRINSNEAGAAVPFYIGDILFTEQAAPDDGEEPPRDPALPFHTVTFEDGTAGGFTGRAGTEQLDVTDEANHTADGSYALKVEGRTSAWHGPSLRVEKYVDKGSEYNISAWIKLIDPASSQLQLSTQVGSGSSANYVALSAKTISTADGWVEYTGSYRYNSAGGEYLTLYVESSNNAAASFYIDDIRFEQTGNGPVEIQKDLVPVKAAYQNDFLIGNAITAEDLDGVRQELLAMHHNVATAGNAMKPDALQPAKGNFTFGAADTMVDKVRAAGMQMHGHVLVWHQQSPAWMNTAADNAGNTTALSRAEALANLQTHIRTVMEHFGDKVISWDVVNEAMNDNPANPADWAGALRQSPWYNAIGTDYVEQAFLAAREVLDEHPEWNIKLYYNDYNEDNQNKAQAIYSMVRSINDSYALTHPGRLLIDGVGMQGHYSINTNPENVRLSLEKFISLGVEVSITELDIQAGSNNQLSDKLAEAQGYLYAQLMDLFKANSAHIKRVTFWGLDDHTSWRAASSPLLFDKNLQAKPAYYGVIEPAKYMAEHQPDTTDANVSEAVYGTPVIDGTVDAVWNTAPGLEVNRYQLAWQGAGGTAKTLWDEQNLYVLIQVSDAQLDKSNPNAWEQDSVEVFLDENNGKTSFYQDDDGQFRVNYDNETSFSPALMAAGFESATKVTGTSYTVEMKIPFKKITPAGGTKIGFDTQINDAKDGARQSVAAWNDTSGNGYQDTSVYGVLTLKAQDGGSTPTAAPTTAPEPTAEPTPAPTPTPAPAVTDIISSSAATPKPAVSVESKAGMVTIRPEVKTEGGASKATLTAELMRQAFRQAAPADDTPQQLVISLPKQTGTTSYEFELPLQSLKGQDNFVLTVQTGSAILTIPGQLLAGIQANTEYVSILIKESPAANTDAAVRRHIGGRPVVELSVSAGGQKLGLNSPDAPVKVSIPYKPAVEELAYLDSLVILDLIDGGPAAAVVNSRYDAADGSLVFRTPQLGTFAAVYAPLAFSDLGGLSWAGQAAAAMTARGIIPESTAGSFSPAESISRADFTAALVRVLELKSPAAEAGTAFGDIRSNAEYSKELAAAKQLGIASGYGDNSFRPDSPVSRQEMMVLAARALRAAGIEARGSGALEDYTDAGQISAYARDSLAALLKYGVVNGKNGRLSPGDTLTRAEAAVILYRIWKL
ncbi:endo-1,4-beta-xylanase [Paenibacillus sp. MMS20-IR301]|uniref:endo-1,4-beta-xylanase n=1 Tax=Paenibacillus sp. MMS20-IR301 TaxID=2895946 RepID=UPI0028E37D31|nr:endo-1,4-beta-xylanase [Paenibacillus sp. MMS20-IR301]WNS46658.1 endo-1,4-beta-xylanase [Paenibacillus sp. MMS20-IR301]